MKRALIAGITGQLGSHMADFLTQKGYEVHGTVRTRKDASGPMRRHPIYDLPKDLSPDEIYNFAADSSPNSSWGSLEPALNSVGVALGLLEMTRALWPGAKFYQASSSEMFGNPTTAPQNEATPFAPRNPYGSAKVFAHNLVRNYRAHYGLFTVSGICFNAEGPRRGGQFVTRKITKAVAAIAQGRQTELILGDLGACRDWGYAGDYVEAMWLTLQQSEPRDYVIATGVQHSVRQFCEAAFARAGLNWREHVKTDLALIRPPERLPLVGDPRRIREQCGWQATTQFEDLVEMMVDADLGKDSP